MSGAEEQRNRFAAEYCVQIIQQMILLAADEGSSEETVVVMPLLPIPAVLEAIKRLPGPKHDLWRDVRVR